MFAYQYAICLSYQTENILRGDVTYFLWHGTRPSYKNIKIWDVRVYIINGRAAIKKIDDRSHMVYLMRYEDTTGDIIYCKPYKHFVMHLELERELQIGSSLSNMF